MAKFFPNGKIGRQKRWNGEKTLLDYDTADIFVKADRSMTQSLAIRLPHYCGPNRRSEPQGDLWHVFMNLASSTTQSRLVLGCTRWGLSSSVPHTFHYFSKTKARKARALGGTTAVVNSTLLLADVMSGVDPVPQDPLPGPPPPVDQLRF